MVAPRVPDLRAALLATAVWAGTLIGLHASLPGVAVTAALCTAAAVAVRRHRLTVVCVVLVPAATLVAAVRAEATQAGPVAGWAEQRAVVEAEMVVRSDPVLRDGRFGDFTVVEARLRRATARGRTVRTSVPVLVLGSPAWTQVRLGSVVQFTGRLAPASSRQEAAVLTGQGDPVVLRGPSDLFRAADAVRASVRRAASSGSGEARDLVPALVTGDDGGLSQEVVDDFAAAGLTHLTAVSGTNLTLVLASLLLVARWCGVRGRGVVVVGVLGVAGFVLLARPEPSVVRAAAMGTVALVGLGSGGPATGVRALGVASFGLLMWDPWLARSPGFALSVLATAGLLLVAPSFRDAMARWLPRWVAEAVAVPLAAQLACTPLVAGLSGEVSLVSVAANLAAAPVVGPATVLGLAGGLVGLVVPTLGAVLSRPATWCAAWIVLVARHAAGMPSAVVEWSTTPVGLALLTLLCATAVLVTPWLLARPRLACGMAGLLVVVVLRPSWHPGWPPQGWILVMCDVGQGDALVLSAGPRTAVVVDAGPDPRLVDGCLRRLGVTRLPAVVLTHFHADHVDGLPGVLRGRSVGELEVSPLRAPVYGAEQVDAWAASARVPVRVPAYGEVVRVGSVTWQVEAPRRVLSDNPNDGSLVLLVTVGKLRILLTGDVEPPSQEPLLEEGVGTVDVLKVPHHGSRYQDPELLTGLRARVALVSVGEDNDYGHPDPGTLRALTSAGATVRRTDEDGDVAVVVQDGRLGVVSRG